MGFFNDFKNRPDDVDEEYCLSQAGGEDERCDDYWDAWFESYYGED